MQKQSGSGCFVAILFSIMLCIALLIQSVVPAIIKAQEKAKVEKANKPGYQQAVEAYRQGEYEKADELFGKLDYNYAHVKEYSTICDARRYYAKGNMSMAKFVLDWYTYSFLSKEEKEEFETFRAAVERGYAVEKAREEREDREKLEERIRTEPPFYGMSESRINDTVLGHYTKLETTITGKDLEQWEVHNYSWMSGGKTLYYASCEKGSVVRVHDYRDHPKSPSGSGADITPYPDVSFFSNPEDFYYFYVDDFDGYQDAEDFYYAHGGK